MSGGRGGSTKDKEVSSATAQYLNDVVKGDTVDNTLLIDIRDEKTGEIYCTFQMYRSQKLQRVYDAFTESKGGDDSFILKLGERRVLRMDTPDSLGMSGHVELKYAPVVTFVIEDAKYPKHEFLVRRDQKLSVLYQKYRDLRGGGSFFFMYRARKLSPDESPESMCIKGRVEITCYQSSSVIFDIINVETQKVEWTMVLPSSLSFRRLFMACENRRPHVNGEPKYSFYLEFNGSRIGYDETPHSLGMKGGKRVPLSYTPNPVIEIDIYKLDGEFIRGGESRSTFVCTVRLTPHQSMDKIYNAYGEGEVSFHLVYKDVAINPDATPDSLGMTSSQRVEVLAVPIVIIDTRNCMNKVVDTFDLARSSTFDALHDSYKEKGSYEYDHSFGSFDFYFNGTIIDLDKDTPETLGMKNRERVECVPTFSQKNSEKEECYCINCRERKAAAHIHGLGEADDMKVYSGGDVHSTIDIVFFNNSSSDEVALRHRYDEKMKTLLSRYAAMREIPLKSLRFKHDDRMLFVSSIGNKSPYDLGMKNRDIVYVSLVENLEVQYCTAATDKKSCPSQGVEAKTRKGNGKAKSKKKATNQPSYSTMDEEERLRRAHSKKLTIIFDEANPQFKKIRQMLNNLALEQTPPKVKSASPRVRATEPTAIDISSISLDNTAIKTRFNILAGEVSNLYKSTKPSKKTEAQQKVSITIDLHGYTKEAAIAKLDASLPSWIDTAMHGNYPFVVPVTIICGAGGQVLSEVVEQWIRGNERVANARKNLFIF